MPARIATTTPSPRIGEVFTAVRGVEFPAGRDRLVQAAEDARADDDVVRMLRDIPSALYANRDMLTRAVRAESAVRPAR